MLRGGGGGWVGEGALKTVCFVLNNNIIASYSPD